MTRPVALLLSILFAREITTFWAAARCRPNSIIADEFYAAVRHPELKLNIPP